MIQVLRNCLAEFVRVASFHLSKWRLSSTLSGECVEGKAAGWCSQALPSLS